MRTPVVFFVVSYCYGILSADLFPCFPIAVTTVFLLISVLMFSTAFLKGKVKTLIVVAALTGFFCMLHAARIPADDISHYASGEKMTITGIVEGPAKYASERVTANIRTLEITKGADRIPVSGRIRLSVYDPEVMIVYGDIIRFTGRLKKIRGFRNPGSFDYAGYMARQGIRASMGVGNKGNIIKTGVGGSRFLRKVYGWREKVRIAVKGGLDSNPSAILQAMAIGSSGEITHEIRDKFIAAGVVHILSISGSHLGFVTLLVFGSARYIVLCLPCGILLSITRYTIPTRIAAIITVPPIVFYTLLSGGETATIRSLIMALVCLMGLIIERENDPLNTLAVAALIVLLSDPQALFDISFQLSYTAVLAMILASQSFHDKRKAVERPGWKGRLINRSFLFIHITLAAGTSTTPITAFYFNQVTWAGLVSNMVVVPFVGIIILPVGLLTCLAALVTGAATIPLAPVNNALLDILFQIVSFFADLPSSVFYVRSPGLAEILSVYVILFSMLFLRRRWAKIAAAISLLILTSSAAAQYLIQDGNGTLRVTFLDVGQGDSALIEFIGGEVMLIDGGGTFGSTFDTGRSILAPYLWNRGIGHVDYIVATHPQMDHVEGLAYIVEKFSVKEVWTNGTSGAASREFERAVHKRKINQVTIHDAIEDAMIGGCRIGFIHPQSKGPLPGSKVNDLSVVMRLICSGTSFLFTGDIEANAMRDISARGRDITSRVIKVPHHGARGSLDENFIMAVRPDIAVISAGYQNSYNHPSDETISVYERAGAAVYRTDRDGAVIVEVQGRRTRTRTYEEMIPEKVGIEEPFSLLRQEWSNIKKLF